ncbi:MAG: hypothetical protein GF315_11170 [candidate division Zixibacteria bacterium]|nr:hypothetical protein [candidate division Zixibacteria bacterium]
MTCSVDKTPDQLEIFDYRPSRSSPKILLIDIGPFNQKIFNSMMSENRLPNIKELMQRNSKLSFEQSPDRYVNNTVAAAEIFTGIDSPFNGVATAYWGSEGSRNFVESTLRELKVPTLEDKLSKNKINSIYINYPLFHPVNDTSVVVISDHFLICPEDGILPRQLKDAMVVHGLIPEDGGIETRIRELLESETAIEKADVEALNRFISYPLSERNLSELVSDNANPGAKGLERCLRLLAWGLRKDRIILATVELLKENYFLPEFMAIRLGSLELAQLFFMRYHFARGFNITPTEMERFGFVLERCYEYQDELIGKIAKKVSRRYDIILVSPYELIPATEWEGRNKSGLEKRLTYENSYPVAVRISPSNFAHAINSGFQPKFDIIFKPPDYWPLEKLPESDNTFILKILPQNLDSAKIRSVISALQNCSNAQGRYLFSTVELTDSLMQKVSLDLHGVPEAGDIYDADGALIFVDDFLRKFPQICAFPVSGGFAITNFIPEKNDKDSMYAVKDIHKIICERFELSSTEYGIDSLDGDLPIPKETGCEKYIRYQLSVLGYIE